MQGGGGVPWAGLPADLLWNTLSELPCCRDGWSQGPVPELYLHTESTIVRGLAAAFVRFCRGSRHMHYNADMHYCHNVLLQHSVVVQDSASAVLASCVGSFAKHSQVEVHGVNSSVNCEDYLLNCPPFKGNVSFGIVASECAFIRLTRTTIVEPVVGFIAKNGANAVLHQTMFSFPRFVGVISAAHSNAELIQCALGNSAHTEILTMMRAAERHTLKAVGDSINGLVLGDALKAFEGGEVSVLRRVMANNRSRAVCAQQRAVV